MSELIVFVFTDKFRAPEVLNELRRRNGLSTQDLDRAVAVTLDGNAKARVHMSVDLSKREAAGWARLWGALLQTAAFVPLTEEMVEAADKLASPSVRSESFPDAAGEELDEFKWWRKVMARSKDFRRDVSALMTANSSAILMMLSTPKVATALKQLHNYGNTIVHMTVGPDQEKQLQAMLARK